MCRRFTEEIFAALISVIFIIEAITAVVKLYTEPPPGSPDDQSAAFLGTMLCFGTYGLAMQLRSIKVRFFLFLYFFKIYTAVRFQNRGGGGASSKVHVLLCV